MVLVEGPRRYAAYITIHGPDHDGTSMPLREGITSFGRLPSNDVILLGELVSRHHSRITYFEGRATFQDLGSHNGSWVNGDRVTNKVLRSGDICRIGNFRITFQVGADDTPRETARLASEGGPPVPPGNSGNSVLLAQMEAARTTRGHEARALRLVLRATDALNQSSTRAGYLAAMLQIALDETHAEFGAFVRASDRGIQTQVARDRRGPVNEPTIVAPVVSWATAKDYPVVTSDLENDLRFGLDPRDIEGRRTVVCVPLGLAPNVRGALYLSRAEPPFSDADLDAVMALSQLAAAGLRGFASSVRHNRNPLLVAHAPSVAATLRRVVETERSALSPVEATVLHARVYGLGAFAPARVPPASVARFLEAFLAAAVEIVEPRGGALETTNGGLVQVVFGLDGGTAFDVAAPLDAALKLRARVDRLLHTQREIGLCRLRAGLDRGLVLAGALFGDRQCGCALVGEPVERSARLELSARAGTLLATGVLRESAGPRFEFQPRGSQNIRGRRPLEIFELVGSR